MDSIDGEVLDIDLEGLRISEIELIEELIDGPIDQALSGDKPKGKTLRALGYVIKRRTNPDFTMEDAGNLIVSFSANGADPTTAANA